MVRKSGSTATSVGTFLDLFGDGQLAPSFSSPGYQGFEPHVNPFVTQEKPATTTYENTAGFVRLTFSGFIH